MKINKKDPVCRGKKNKKTKIKIKEKEIDALSWRPNYERLQKQQIYKTMFRIRKKRINKGKWMCIVKILDKKK